MWHLVHSGWAYRPVPEAWTRSKNILKVLEKKRTPFTKHVPSSANAFSLFVVDDDDDDDNYNKINLLNSQTSKAKKEEGKSWKDTDEREMEAVIGCLLHAGALKQNDLSVECLIGTVGGLPLDWDGLAVYSTIFDLMAKQQDPFVE